MQYRFLGKARLKVSAIGFGCPTFQGKLSDADAKRDIAIIHRAIDLGVNFIDTADHNDGNNEQLLAKALKGKRGQVVLTSKLVISAANRGRGRKGEMSTDGRSTWRKRARRRYGACRPIPSISIICTASIRKFPSKTPSAQ